MLFSNQCDEFIEFGRRFETKKKTNEIFYVNNGLNRLDFFNALHHLMENEF